VHNSSGRFKRFGGEKKRICRMKTVNDRTYGEGNQNFFFLGEKRKKNTERNEPSGLDEFQIDGKRDTKYMYEPSPLNMRYKEKESPLLSN
jgi:hypothetical protein